MANSKKALDENGVLYLWGKVKTYVATAIANIKLPSKTSDLTNDSGFITAKDVPEGAAASSTVPKMDGTAAAGTETAFARGDHVHPSDTTKVDKVEGKGLSANDYTNEEKAKLGGVEANANNYTLPDASASVKGGVTVGTNVDVSGGKISVKNGTTNQKGVVQLSSATDDTSTTKAATPSAVKAAYDLAAGKQSPATSLAGYGIADAYTKDEVDAKMSSALEYKGSKDTYEFIWCYCPEMAERKYQENLRAKGPNLKIGNDIDFANYVEQKIVEEHYSPAALLAELKAKPPQFDTTVCEATLYNYIYRGDVFLVLNPEHLHEKGRRHYGEKYGEQRNAARAAKGPRIDKRDPIINSRTTFGHWEMDSVMGTVGSSRALVVLTERLTRAGIILPVPDHTAASVVRALNGLERRLGKDFYPMFQSITVDNGCEFQDYDGMEKACRRKGKRTTVYYCHPHAPHERGSNENMNRIIRRFFPKGTNFDEVPISEIRRAEEWMNNYPREVLGWQTAATLLRSYMSVC